MVAEIELHRLADDGNPHADYCGLCNGTSFPGTTERNCPDCEPETPGRSEAFAAGHWEAFDWFLRECSRLNDDIPDTLSMTHAFAAWGTQGVWWWDAGDEFGRIRLPRP